MNHGLPASLDARVGRLVCNRFPTVVEVCHARNYGGLFPSTSDRRSTSVGTRAIQRFARPVCYLGFPDAVHGWQAGPELNLIPVVGAEVTRLKLKRR